MLSLTRRHLSPQQKARVQLAKSSLEDYQGEDASFDAVILNMVLHHLSSPRQAFARIRQLIRPLGCLLVADLCAHDQEWVRESCGDVWLGFEPQELKEWAFSAGFNEPQAIFIGLKNGFQVQILLFRAGN